MTNNVRFTFRIPKDLMQKIKEQANKTGISVNAQILFILNEWLKAHKNT